MAASIPDEQPAIILTSQRSQVKLLLFDCLRKSTVRGLPRILNTGSACLKTLWTSAVFIFFVMMMYTIAMLTVVYLRGDVVMTWKPWTPRPPFPSITVCDASPMTRSGLQSLPLTPSRYAERIKVMAEATEDAGNLTTAYLQELLTPMAYHDQLDAGHLRSAANRDPLVLGESCRIYYESDGVKRSRPCGRVTKVEVPGYFSCSTVDVSSDSPGEEVYRLALHVLLDSDVDGLRCSRCITDNVESFKTGAIVYLHERDVYPVDISDGLRLSPGTQSFVHVKATQIFHQRFCQPATPEILTLYLSDRLRRVKYTTELCDHLDRHDAYKNECNCSMNCLPQSQPDHHSNNTYTSCFRQNLTASSLDLARLTCVMQLDGKLPRDAAGGNGAVRTGCHLPCHNVRFTVARSEAKGINSNSALDFFERYVLNTTAYEVMQDRLEVYARALELRAAGMDSEARRLLANATYLMDNLITAIFQFNQNKAKQVSENYVLGQSAFISQIGGLLSLFSGITVICIAEIGELMWLVSRHLWGRCKKATTDGTAGTDGTAAA